VREEQDIEDETNLAKLGLDDETHSFYLHVYRKWYEEWHSVDDRKWKGSFKDTEGEIQGYSNSVCLCRSSDREHRWIRILNVGVSHGIRYSNTRCDCLHRQSGRLHVQVWTVVRQA